MSPDIKCQIIMLLERMFKVELNLTTTIDMIIVMSITIIMIIGVIISRILKLLW